MQVCFFSPLFVLPLLSRFLLAALNARNRSSALFSISVAAVSSFLLLTRDPSGGSAT